MNKFIRVEDTILNTNNIEAVYINYRIVKYGIVKYGDEWYDEDEKVEDGVMVVMTNNPQPYVFTTVSLGEFMRMLG